MMYNFTSEQVMICFNKQQVLRFFKLLKVHNVYKWRMGGSLLDSNEHLSDMSERGIWKYGFPLGFRINQSGMLVLDTLNYYKGTSFEIYYFNNLKPSKRLNIYTKNIYEEPN